MLPDIFAVTMQTTQFIHQLGSVHKAQIHSLPGQRMDGVRRVAHQRQTMRRKLARIATG
ncbi:hypothetical protein D3C76_1827800 [compost metagenome]